MLSDNPSLANSLIDPKFKTSKPQFATGDYVLLELDENRLLS